MHLLRTLALTTLLVALTACGEDEPDRALDQGSGPAVDELSEHDGKPCPSRLAEPESSGPADEAPTIATPDRGWLCTYSVERWTLQGEPFQLGDDDLADLTAALGTLEPAPADQACTMELGPRVMAVTGADGDLTGTVVDLFGCRDVRVTEEPFETAPGTDGVLSSPELVTLVTDLASLSTR